MDMYITRSFPQLNPEAHAWTNGNVIIEHLSDQRVCRDKFHPTMKIIFCFSFKHKILSMISNTLISSIYQSSDIQY